MMRDDASLHSLDAEALARQHSEALVAARTKLGARVARGGGQLPLFLCLDALISVAVGAVTVRAIALNGWGPSDWVFWTVLPFYT